MVSTRGPKYKFSQGERVLCYEPDPTKAKVLYDSKVLEVIEQKNKRGRRTVQYLIHFKGWNSSWDRCVGEELVLKDTEHNRQLQRTLAERAQLQIGTYLYRKERKKVGSGSSTTGTTTTGKRPRASDVEDEDLNTFSSQEEGDVEEEQSEEVSQANSRSSTGGNSSSCEESDSSSEYHSDEYGPASIHIGPTLRQHLTQDYELVNCQGRLVQLPCHPNALQVLEGCVKHHTKTTIVAHTPPPPQADIQEQARRLNILREVADGLRVYLDFILRDQLLYESERQQYCQAVADGLLKETQPMEMKQQEDSNTNKSFPEDYAHLPPSPHLNSQSLKIKCESTSPSRTIFESEPESKISKNNNQSNVPPNWQNLRIKVEENNSDSKETYTNNLTEWGNKNKVKSISDELVKCSNSQDSRKSRDSPLHRYNIRETRTSSCLSELTSDTQPDSINDNGQIYNSDATSTISSHEGSQSELIKANSDNNCPVISNNVNNKISNNITVEQDSVNNQGVVVKNNNSKVKEFSNSESGRVLRGCVKKLEKTERCKNDATDNGSNSNNNKLRKRRAKRPRLSARRLRSQKPRTRIEDSPVLPPPPPAPSTLPNSQPVELNSQTDLPNKEPVLQNEQIAVAASSSSQPGPSKIQTETPPVPVLEINGGINDEFKGALEWRIVPADYPPYPAAIFGAVHLARLFVKLPEYLSVINMPESKLELIVEFAEYFVKYLEEHSEWFGESFYYIPNTSDS